MMMKRNIVTVVPAVFLLFILVFWIRFSIPSIHSNDLKSASLQWVAKSAGKQIQLQRTQTDRGDPAVMCNVSSAGKTVFLEFKAQVNLTFSGSKKILYAYRLKGWKELRYIACGFETTSTQRLLAQTPPWMISRDKWAYDVFNTHEIFYMPAYLQIVGEQHVRSAYITFLIVGIPDGTASAELWASPVMPSDVEDPRNATVRIQTSNRSFANSVHMKEICDYFSHKPLVLVSSNERSAQDRRSKHLPALAIADEIVHHNRYKLGNVAPVLLPENLTWTESPYSNPNWHFYFHSLEFLKSLTTAYQVTQDRIYFDKAQELVDSWIKLDMMSLHPNNETWQDATTAIRLNNLLYFWEKYRVCEPEPEFMNRLLTTIYLHGQLLARPRFYAKDQPTRFHNHAMLQDYALASLANILPELPESKEWQTVVAERTKEQIENVITKEGVHKEHSPSYHYMTMALLSFINERLDDEHKLKLPLYDALSQMGEFLVYTISPDSRTLLLGDGGAIGFNDMKSINFEEYPNLCYVLTQGKKGKQPLRLDAVFPESGYAFFRDSWGRPDTFDQSAYIAFVSAYHSLNHKHFDDLSFVAYACGEWWLIDPGIYTYDRSDPFYMYYRSFHAHNAIVIDGYTPPLLFHDIGKSRITRWKIAKSHCLVEATQSLIPGISIKRTLYYLKPNIVIVLDEIESQRSHSISFPLHFSRNHDVRKMNKNQFIVHSRESGNKMRITALWPKLTTEIIKGQIKPQVQGWISPDYNERLPSPVLELSTTGANVKLITILDLPSSRQTVSFKDLLKKNVAELPELQSLIAEVN